MNTALYAVLDREIWERYKGVVERFVDGIEGEWDKKGEGLFGEYILRKWMEKVREN